eukprot:CAMPEP_0177631654 /NCGR_PEP_ID=MMETSP0447-20121125/1865_1 /TAXON_ID=0 /ORGANISM="Stygamoeba regulata, Strain BSH-02190019" /LENGTH=664 /DNA_ID=CAMNT_0019133153 /DNA_START=22 /DNA_END=2016 /DNA_ORIENTATION=+
MYKCQKCYNFTLKCMYCSEAMSRSFEDWCDKFCSKCDGSIQNWEAASPPQLTGWCSWCFTCSTHCLLQKNYARRSVFKCTACHKRTVMCRKCNLLGHSVGQQTTDAASHSGGDPVDIDKALPAPEAPPRPSKQTADAAQRHTSMPACEAPASSSVGEGVDAVRATEAAVVESDLAVLCPAAVESDLAVLCPAADMCAASQAPGQGVVGGNAATRAAHTCGGGEEALDTAQPTPAPAPPAAFAVVPPGNGGGALRPVSHVYVFARGYSAGDDQLCYSCNGAIATWEGAAKGIGTQTTGWCSWCMQRCKHVLEERPLFSTVRRNVYLCTSCMSRTLCCVWCKDGMARGTSSIDDFRCLRCSRGLPWESMQDERDFIFCHWNRERLTAELERRSEYRDLAQQHGMVRPFLLLVSMPFFQRCKVANFLGWSLFGEEYFGDPHAEAWSIINKPTYGLQSRTHSAWRKLNLFRTSANWWEILVAVIAKCFRMKVQNLDWGDSLPVSNRKGKIMRLEEEFLLEIARTIFADMTTEQVRQWKDELGRDEDSPLHMQRMRDIGGFTLPAVTLYAVDIARSASGLPLGQYSLMMLGLNTTSQLVPELAPLLLPVTAKLALLATPLALLGGIGLVVHGTNLILGASEARLLAPLTLIINQRILLADAEMRIEDYY